MAFRASTSATNTGVTSLACNKPTGTADGDELRAVIACASAATITQPSGWTEIYTNTIASQRVSVARKTASSEPASWTWSLSASVGVVVAVGAFSGRTAGADDANGGQTNAASTSVTAPSISPSASNCDLYGFFVKQGGGSFTPPGSMTEQEDVTASTGGQRTAELATEVLVSSGATGTRVATASSSSDNLGFLGAIAPAVVASSVSLLVASP